MGAGVEFRVLGPLEAIAGGVPIALGGAQQRALLAVLLLHRREAISTDRLIEELWGERPPPTATKTVQVYVSQLRKVLGDGLLETHGRAYLLAADPERVDLDCFEALAANGRRALDQGDDDTAVRLLREALELWRGPPLADFAYESFAQSEIARLDEVRLAALEDRIDAELGLGRHNQLVAELEALVREHPLRERLRGQLMLALYRAGRQADALARYTQARSALIDELGLEPGRALGELERKILARDPLLDAPTRQTSVLGRAAASRRSRRGGLLIAVGGVLLLAMVVAAIVELTSTGTAGLARVEPNSVAAIDTQSNEVVGQVSAGARPSGIAFASGSLWVANVDDQTVSRIDPSTLQPLRTLALAGPPTGIAAGGGAVWVVSSEQGATSVAVTRIDPQFAVITHTARLGNIVPGGTGSVAAQGDAVWVAPSSGLLARLDPATGRVVRQLDPNAGPAAVGLGAGAVWLTDTEADNVTRVDQTSLLRSIPIGHGPSGIAVGAGGVWVADSLDDTVVRIDPSTQAVTTTIPVGQSPAGVAIGAGSVWVADSGDGTVTRIDPRTDKVTATIFVGGSPQAILVVGRRAWVTVDPRKISPAAVGTVGGTLRMDSQADVDFMDPALAYTPLSEQLLHATCAQLLNYPDRAGPAGSQLVPEVALALPARSADGRTYTFTIRNGYRFSPPSNAPVTAQTFKYTIERTLSPIMKSPVARQFTDIVGARAYMAARAAHISGVSTNGDKLTVRLVAPSPDFPSRISEPAFCAVPANTPIDPNGVRVIPSAGPYDVASYAPGQGVVLARNPNYHGNRPDRLERIELAVGISTPRAFAAIERGAAEYTPIPLGGSPASGLASNVADEASQLDARYGPRSAAAAHGDQQYFVNAIPQLDYFDLNTHRPLFADVRMRQAVNYAIDRRALAQLGDGYQPLPERTTDHILAPGIPGFMDPHVYPSRPDLGKARQLAHGDGRTAVLYTCDDPTCAQHAQIVKTDLAAIGLHVVIKAFQVSTLFARIARPGEPFDLAESGWLPDYPDPASMMTPLLEDSTIAPAFDDPSYQRQLAAAARLSGPARYLAYAKLDAELTRNAAPLVAYGNLSNHDFFSARIGCQTSGVYGIDLAALCIRPRSAR
jgi:YVTN family beta-propeller protein